MKKIFLSLLFPILMFSDICFNWPFSAHFFLCFPHYFSISFPFLPEHTDILWFSGPLLSMSTGNEVGVVLCKIIVETVVFIQSRKHQIYPVHLSFAIAQIVQSTFFLHEISKMKQSRNCTGEQCYTCLHIGI
jgi:hypothetical protein